MLLMGWLAPWKFQEIRRRIETVPKQKHGEKSIPSGWWVLKYWMRWKFILMSSVAIFTQRTFGRSKKGERAYRKIASQSGGNITVCAAICAELGMVYYQIYSGGIKKDLFVNFLEAVSANVIAEFGTTICAYLIFDNAPSHRSVEEATAIGTSN